MIIRQLSHIYVSVRNFLLGIFNREFLIFLFFLVLSAVYWFMSVLNDTMEREITIPVQLVNIPRNAIMLNSETAEMRVMVRDKGYTIAAYKYGDRAASIKLPFDMYAVNNEKCVVNSSDLQKLVSTQLYASTKVVSIKPQTLEFPFNYGLNKRVPVKLVGTVRPAESYYLARVKFEPDSVYVYASSRTLDSILYVSTRQLDIRNFTDTIQRKVALQKTKRVKTVPAEVTMTLYPDIMIEAVANVPVTAINVPEGCVLRTFPPQVQVHYVVGAKQYNNIDVSNFTVVADYSSTAGGEQKKCQLRLVKSPRAARNPYLSTTQVDYLIEQ